MIEHRLLEFSTNMDEETLKVGLLPGSVQIWIEVYDGDMDAFVSRLVEVEDPDDIDQLGRILSSHAESIRSGTRPSSPASDAVDPADSNGREAVDGVVVEASRSAQGGAATSFDPIALPLMTLVDACRRKGILQTELYGKTSRLKADEKTALQRGILERELVAEEALAAISFAHPETMRSLAVLRDELSSRTCQGCDGVVARRDDLDCMMRCDACHAKSGLPPIAT